MNGEPKKPVAVVFVSEVLLTLLASGCSTSQGLIKQDLEKVKTCSAGFSQDVALAVISAFDEAIVAGLSRADFKANIESVLLSKLPTAGQLEKINEFMTCIESGGSQKGPAY